MQDQAIKLCLFFLLHLKILCALGHFFKFSACFVLNQEKERKARCRGKALQNEEATAAYPAEEEEMEGSGASGNEEEAPEDGEGTPIQRAACTMLTAKTSMLLAFINRRVFEHNGVGWCFIPIISICTVGKGLCWSVSAFECRSILCKMLRKENRSLCRTS